MHRIVSRLRVLLRDRAGSPSVDFALTLPALVVVTLGVMQLGIAFLANAGLRNAIEAGARYATVYPYPTDSAIQTKVRTSAFGLDPSQLSTPTITRGTSNGENYVDVTATYPVRFNLIFITTPALTLSYSRRAYQL